MIQCASLVDGIAGGENLFLSTEFPMAGRSAGVKEDNCEDGTSKTAGGEMTGRAGGAQLCTVLVCTFEVTVSSLSVSPKCGRYSSSSVFRCLCLVFFLPK